MLMFLRRHDIPDKLPPRTGPYPLCLKQRLAGVVPLEGGGSPVGPKPPPPPPGRGSASSAITMLSSIPFARTPTSKSESHEFPSTDLLPLLTLAALALNFAGQVLNSGFRFTILLR